MTAGAAAAAEGRAVPLASLAIAMVSFQVGASLAKHLFPLVGAAGAATLRLVMAAVVLGLVIRPWRQAALVRARWRALLLYGASVAGMNCLFYMALRTVPLGIVVALEFVGPLAVACAHARARLDWLWIVFAVGGLLFLLPLRGAASAIDPTGTMLALGAGACWAVYMIAGKIAGQGHGAAAAAIGLAVAALLILPIGIATAGAALLDGHAIALGLAVAILSSALPYTLEMVALIRLPAQTYGTLTSADPVLAALAGLALLGETLRAQQWLAIAAIVAASIGTALTATPEPEPQL